MSFQEFYVLCNHAELLEIMRHDEQLRQAAHSNNELVLAEDLPDHELEVDDQRFFFFVVICTANIRFWQERYANMRAIIVNRGGHCDITVPIPISNGKITEIEKKIIIRDLVSKIQSCSTQ